MKRESMEEKEDEERSNFNFNGKVCCQT